MDRGILTSGRSVAKSRLQAERLDAVQAAMLDQGYDALVVAGRGLLTQYGYFEYISGFNPLVRLAYAVVRRDGAPVLVMSTASDAWYAQQATGLDDIRVAGTGDVVGGQDSLPAAVTGVLTAHRLDRGRVGVVGLGHIVSAGDHEELRSLLPEAELSDATGLLNEIKAVKSAQELEEVRRSCAIADVGMDAFRDYAGVGVTGWELWGEMQRAVRTRGAREVLVMISSGQYFNDPPRDEPLREGDLVSVYVEISGPNGFWVEKASLFSIGDIGDRRRTVADACLRGHEAATGMVVAGSTAADVAHAVEKQVAGLGVDFGIWHGHGVGVDHDVPVIGTSDETRLTSGMVLALHPNLVDAAHEVGASVADTFIVTPEGPPERGSAHDQCILPIERGR
ncbi:M24 family metallopeptidase [Pseudonocardia parietis]|uniref:Xaa-Pro aminopeptidase n=1 Tax=Pseudonocardia parietis TaxID=570936 RepID=A0ABS4VPL0_9PSEU|nr:Xaa-Pro peptidase family protein [Pseudonocardia parietis]MBP2365872.1 Xaa-Pro aminopeptidase [Pseudonocardia parietis]